MGLWEERTAWCQVSFFVYNLNIHTSTPTYLRSGSVFQPKLDSWNLTRWRRECPQVVLGPPFAWCGMCFQTHIPHMHSNFFLKTTWRCERCFISKLSIKNHFEKVFLIDDHSYWGHSNVTLPGWYFLLMQSSQTLYWSSLIRLFFFLFSFEMKVLPCFPARLEL